MKTNNKLGIFMDHASALFIHFPIDEATNHSIFSSFTNSAKQDSLEKSEQLTHNKEQHQQNEFYQKIGEEIRHFDEVMLFGPTSAKTELFNILKKNHLFDSIKIHIEQTDKLTENQKLAFVKKYFINQL
jgi:alkyl sulfatase BDS1-like metallo-beta-lactamase superfamily hydrolase